MSDWQIVKKEDVEISDNGETLEVFIGSDEFGANYVEVPIEDILDLIRDRGLSKVGK